MYLLTHALVLVLVAVMKPKELKTKISHANSLTLSVDHSPIYRRMKVCMCLHMANGWCQGRMEFSSMTHTHRQSPK